MGTALKTAPYKKGETMSRAVRYGVIALGVLVVLGLLLPRLVNVNSFRPKLEAELTTALGRQVTVGNLDLSIFSGSVSADNIAIADDPAFSKGPFISAKSFKAGVEVMPLIFSKTLHIQGITLTEPQITLLRGANGTWNFSSLGGSSTAPGKPADEKAGANGSALSVDRLSIDNGRLLMGSANSQEKPAVYDNVKLEVNNFSTTAQFPFTLTSALPGGGEFSLKGKCGPIPAGNAIASPLEASMAVRKLDLAAGIVAPSAGIHGLADFDGTVASDGQVVKTSGTLKADKLQLVAKGAPSKRTVTLAYAVNHSVKTDAGSVTQGDISIGKAVAHLTGTYQTQGQVTTINMKVDGSNMPLDEIEAALPALGVVLPAGSKLQGGALSANLAVAGSTQAPLVNGQIQLSNAKLAGFDTSSKLSALPGLSGNGAGGKDTVIQNLSTTVRLAPEGTQANAINLTIPSLGVVTGGGTISPSGVLDFAMNVDLASRSGSGVPFGIEGTTSDPKFVPNVKAIAGKAIASKVAGVKPEGPLSGRIGRKR
jgi:AsmA protein